MKIKEFKQELKKLASDIRKAKESFKYCQRAGDYEFKAYKEWAIRNGYCDTFWNKQFARMPDVLSHHYRHMHIAYCLLRGRKYEQIEPKTREDNKPNMSLVEQYMAQYREVEPVSCGETTDGQ